MTYPPEPWHLRGRMHLSLWRVPHEQLPRELPPGTRPVLLGGHAVAATAWVVYEPGGDLTYNELLVAVFVRQRLRLRACITDIWVDSPASMQGGRDLWSIPKELATFALAETRAWTANAHTSDTALATAEFRTRAHVPGTWNLVGTITQSSRGQRKDTRLRCRTRLETAAAYWHIEAQGPLAWLRGARPLLSLRLRDFALDFGDASSDLSRTQSAPM